jgi:hypothetical protein
MITKVVNCKTASYDVYIGRPSKWGNPFVIGKDGDRYEVIRKYKEFIVTIPDYKRVIKEQLRGKTLGCWCCPKICHGDVLAGIADSD